MIGIGESIRGDKQKANQALAVQLRKLRFDGVDPIQELGLYIYPKVRTQLLYHQHELFKGLYKLTSTTPVRGKREDGGLPFAAPLFAATEAEIGGLVVE